ncbi:MAG: InlB B-repeat-containing protein [Spirochaetales bacterium]|nr:InlB B-repeat-containing protein [Spirochaetales bacterium]
MTKNLHVVLFPLTIIFISACGKEDTRNTTPEHTATETEKKGHSVIFDSRGGSAVSVQTVGHDALAMEPANPTKPGSPFVGWYSDSHCTRAWDFNSDKVTSDMTLYARWLTITPGLWLGENIVFNVSSDGTMIVPSDDLQLNGLPLVYKPGGAVYQEIIIRHDGCFSAEGPGVTIKGKFTSKDSALGTGEAYTGAGGPWRSYSCPAGTKHVGSFSMNYGVHGQFHHGRQKSVAFSPDGNYVLSGSAKGSSGDLPSVNLWHTATGKEVAMFFTYHELQVNSAAFSPDGKYAISASDSDIRLWDLSA